MMKTITILSCSIAAIMLGSCNQKGAKSSMASADTIKNTTGTTELPQPYATRSVRNFSKVIGWPAGKTPVAPQGFKVARYADHDLKSPRWIYVAPNGDVLVSQANSEPATMQRLAGEMAGQGSSQHLGNSANKITLFRDTTGDGKPDIQEIFLSGLNQPFGMLILGNSFYVANTDGLWRFPYKTGQRHIEEPGTKILVLPAGGYNNHWTRNIIANPDGTKIYISVGSGSNVAEHGMDNEIRRANIIEINPDGSGERIYAGGLRNPVGMAWVDNTLWTAVNERDGLGDELVPDYVTRVAENGFYGWPYAYMGQHKDPRVDPQRNDLVAKTIVPDIPLGSHTASLGLFYYQGDALPGQYGDGMFISQHGSWNRSTLSGYKVLFVPFVSGRPSGEPQDFLTGFIANAEKSEVYGRPVGVAVLPDGSLLVADDASDVIWRVSVVR